MKPAGKRTPEAMFNLAMEISALSLRPGERRTHHDLACFVSATMEEMTGKPFPMSWQRFHQMEQKALRKIRIFVTRELNINTKETLLDGLALLASMQHTMWDRTVSRLHR